MLIHCPGFPVVALLAKRLPVTLVPEERPIATVGLDMIHNRCRHKFSCPLTLYAKRMLCQELLSCLLPTTAVAALKGTSPVTNVQFGMKLAVTIVCQSRAARMLAWPLRFCRHEH